MRRILAILLGLTFVLPFAAPFEALAEDAHATCVCPDGQCHCKYCKRHHHYGELPSNAPVFLPPPCACPCNQRMAPVMTSGRVALVSSSDFGATVVAMPAPAAQALVLARTLQMRTQPLRGPPAIVS
jgi:hypothetical protein